MRPLLAPPVRQVAAAVDTSPHLLGVLAEAGRLARRLEAPLLLIHAGPPDAQKETAFRDALLTMRLPRETRLVWQPGEPADAIAAIADAESVDLVIAGVLDHHAAPNPTYVGAVARPLAEQARCSVLLLSHPQAEPRFFRRIVVMTDFSDCAKAALNQALWLACADGAERVEVVALYTAFMRARAKHGRAGRTRQETERRLVEFVADSPACGVALDVAIVEGTTGFGAYDYTQSAGADLLVVPAPPHLEGAVPPRMNWALQVTPCSLWVVRETVGPARSGA